MEYKLRPNYLCSKDKLEDTDLTPTIIEKGVNSAYHILKEIDLKLHSMGSSPLAELMELANLSSFLGNLISAGIALHSEKVFSRNRPHTYPDLVHYSGDMTKNIELKVALEINKPKGHLAKKGNYFTIRYVLGNIDGSYTRKKENRGTVVWIWELKFGHLTKTDFALSNTEGDSGKTAPITTDALRRMTLVYFDPSFCPYAKLPYPEPEQATLE